MLKKESDLLYKSTKKAIDTAKARNAQNIVKKIFNAKSIDDLEKKVFLYSNQIRNQLNCNSYNFL